MQDNGSKHKEQLKQKQAEFEEEMKKKTKHLKPRVIGSLWMADANNNPGIFFFNENDCGLKKIIIAIGVLGMIELRMQRF